MTGTATVQNARKCPVDSRAAIHTVPLQAITRCKLELSRFPLQCIGVRIPAPLQSERPSGSIWEEAVTVPNAAIPNTLHMLLQVSIWTCAYLTLTCGSSCVITDQYPLMEPADYVTVIRGYKWRTTWASHKRSPAIHSEAKL